MRPTLRLKPHARGSEKKLLAILCTQTVDHVEVPEIPEEAQHLPPARRAARGVDGSMVQLLQTSRWVCLQPPCCMSAMVCCKLRPCYSPSFGGGEDEANARKLVWFKRFGASESVHSFVLRQSVLRYAECLRAAACSHAGPLASCQSICSVVSRMQGRTPGTSSLRRGCQIAAVAPLAPASSER